MVDGHAVVDSWVGPPLAAVSVCTSLSVDVCFPLSWKMPPREAVGRVFNCGRSCHVTFRSGCTIWHSHWDVSFNLCLYLTSYSLAFHVI